MTGCRTAIVSCIMSWVSPTWSVPQVASPQIWRRFIQWPTSWVAVLPLLKGAAAVPVLPVALSSNTTPSVAEEPPGIVRSLRYCLPYYKPRY